LRRKKTKKKKQKKQKKTKKNICKTYTHPPPTGRRLRKLGNYKGVVLYTWLQKMVDGGKNGSDPQASSSNHQPLEGVG